MLFVLNLQFCVNKNNLHPRQKLNNKRRNSNLFISHNSIVETSLVFSRVAKRECVGGPTGGKTKAEMKN